MNPPTPKKPIQAHFRPSQRSCCATFVPSSAATYRVPTLCSCGKETAARHSAHTNADTPLPSQPAGISAFGVEALCDPFEQRRLAPQLLPEPIERRLVAGLQLLCERGQTRAIEALFRFCERPSARRSQGDRGYHSHQRDAERDPRGNSCLCHRPSHRATPQRRFDGPQAPTESRNKGGTCRGRRAPPRRARSRAGRAWEVRQGGPPVVEESHKAPQ